MTRAFRFLRPDRPRALLFAAAILLCATRTDGIILYRTGDPTANTTAPPGSLTGSGWQYEGMFGDYLGTVIAPHFFMTAQHIGYASNTFIFQGQNYTVLSQNNDSTTDLCLYEVAETFPIYAPIYTGNAEVGKHLVVIGRGKQRGAAVMADGTLRGWQWGATDTVERWGENEVSAIKQLAPVGDMVYALFDENGLPNEGHLANGDSGGGVFVDDNGVWKLAGINYDVDYAYTQPNGQGILFAALFDERGLYDENRNLVAGNSPVPSGFYASRVSVRSAWVDSVVEPRLVNISARASIGANEQATIAGFIIEGNAGETQTIIIRGLGPSLETSGVPVPGRLMDPMLELHNSTGAVIATNDNWASSPQATAIQNAELAPTDPREAAILVTLPVGSYTAVLRGAAGGTGIGLIEIYDADVIGHGRLLNLSARANVAAGDNTLIGGLIVHSSSQQLLLRAIGPDLASRGVTGALSNPILELHDSNGALLSSNDDWQHASNNSAITGTGLAPNDPRDSAILLTPTPGNYTAIVRGKDGTTGIALLESYLIE